MQQQVAEKLILTNQYLLACTDASFKCYNGGTCTNFEGSPRCDCPAGTYGKFCEIGEQSRFLNSKFLKLYKWHKIEMYNVNKDFIEIFFRNSLVVCR